MTMRYDFTCDYLEGACPEILDRLVETNYVQEAGYGADGFTAAAIEKIREACRAPEAQIRLLAGGTQTNQIMIDALLGPHEGVVSVDAGHVNTHEAGAIEYTGHKVLTLPQHEGKMDPEELRDFMQTFYADETYEHQVFPGLVYLTHPTEIGTLYSRAEIQALVAVAREFGMRVYLDGARLAYGLAAMERGATDVDLPFLAETLDAFYIGGTKQGALLGEAAVFPRGDGPEHFLTFVKRHGALLEKGRVVALAFDAFFTDGLYQRLGAHALDMAEKMKGIFHEKGYRFYMETPTNQQFFIIENSKMAALKERVGFDFWEKYDDSHTVIRFCTSWATKEEAVEALREAL